MARRDKHAGKRLAEAMLQSWTDDAVFQAEPAHIVASYGVSLTEAERLLEMERLNRTLRRTA